MGPHGLLGLTPCVQYVRRSGGTVRCSRAVIWQRNMTRLNNTAELTLDRATHLGGRHALGAPSFAKRRVGDEPRGAPPGRDRAAFKPRLGEAVQANRRVGRC